MTREILFWLLSLTILLASFAIGQDETNGVPDSSVAIDLNPEKTPTPTPSSKDKILSDEESEMVDWLERTNIPQGESADRKIAKLAKEAQFQSRIGNSEGAIAIYDKILEIDPDNTVARFSKGTLFIKLDRYSEALAILINLAKDNPNDYTIKNNIAWVLATANDIHIRNGKKAISLARDALLQAPNDYHVWNTLSEAYFVSADYDKALTTANIALQIAVDNGEPNQVLQNLAEQLRKCKQAAVTMQIME